MYLLACKGIQRGWNICVIDNHGLVPFDPQWSHHTSFCPFSWLMKWFNITIARVAQDLLTILRKHMISTSLLRSFCTFVCLCVFCFVRWCPVRFLRENNVWFALTSICFVRGSDKLSSLLATTEKREQIKTHFIYIGVII